MTHATDHNKHPLTSCYALCLAVLLFSIIAPHTAHAVLMTETQIIINSQDRTAELTIKNTSNQTSIYRFVWDHIGFNADGEFKRIEDGNFPDGLTPVDDYIRFAPRRNRRTGPHPEYPLSGPPDKRYARRRIPLLLFVVTRRTAKRI